MSNQISDTKLHDAYVKAKLGTDDTYAYWSLTWAIRSRIWRKKKEQKVAKEVLGEWVYEAIDIADQETLDDLADSLKLMLKAERSPAYALLADVFFAVEELNNSFEEFSKADLLHHLNRKMQAVMTAPEVETALAQMGLDRMIPGGGKLVY